MIFSRDLVPFPADSVPSSARPPLGHRDFVTSSSGFRRHISTYLLLACTHIYLVHLAPQTGVTQSVFSLQLRSLHQLALSAIHLLDLRRGPSLGLDRNSIMGRDADIFEDICKEHNVTSAERDTYNKWRLLTDAAWRWGKEEHVIVCLCLCSVCYWGKGFVY